jgi:hypothetical protein
LKTADAVQNSFTSSNSYLLGGIRRTFIVKQIHDRLRNKPAHILWLGNGSITSACAVKGSISYQYLSFAAEAAWLVVAFAFTELRKILGFLIELTEPGVLPIKGELNAPNFCALFVLPLDSSQARSLASMSILSFGVSSLWAEDTKLEMCRDRAAKLTVWTDSWYSPGFYNQIKEVSLKFFVQS